MSTRKRLAALEQAINDLPNRVRVDVHRRVTVEHESDDWAETDADAGYDRALDEYERRVQRAFERTTGQFTDWWRETSEPWASLAETRRITPSELRSSIRRVA